MATRIVRHLRLRGSDEAVIRHIALRLEDALRTASLPEAGGRLVLVRRLALGRIPRDAAPQTLALSLEQHIAALAATSLPASDQDADAAPVVYFRDALEAHSGLALRLLAGAPVDAWYWPLAVPAWRRGMPVAEALRRLAHSLAAQPEAPVALPLWAAALVRAGYGRHLEAALGTDDVTPLARAAGIRRAPPPDETPAAASPRATDRTSPPRAQRRATQTTPRQPADAPRQLLQSLLAAAGAPPMDMPPPAPPVTPPRQAHLTDDSGAAPTQPPDGDAAHSPSPVAATLPPAGRRRPAPPGPGHPDLLPPRPRPSPLPRRPAQARPGLDTQPHPEARPAVTAAPPSRWTFDGVITSAGGLLFLLPVLGRLDYPAWLAAHPAWAAADLPRQIFGEVLARLSIPADDPAWSLARQPRPAIPPRHFVAPAAWPGQLATGTAPLRLGNGGATRILWDRSGRLPLGAWQGPCPRPLQQARRRAIPTADSTTNGILAIATRAWLTACRRWLRRQAGIGIADLVLRPAELAITPTHIDLFFALAQADLRLRRPGLDLDPGWLPWFGRVINFHYRPQRGA